MAELVFYHGPMGAGKGAQIAQQVYNARQRGLDVATVKPASDTKGGGNIVSRISVDPIPVDILAYEADATMNTPETDIRRELFRLMGERGVRFAGVFVDEIQFLTRLQTEQLATIAAGDNIPVTCFGLRMNVYRQLFSGSAHMLGVAHQVHELQHNVRCPCGEKAVYNGRYVDDMFDIDPSGPERRIDGAEDNVRYEAFCATCHHRETEAARIVLTAQKVSVAK